MKNIKEPHITFHGKNGSSISFCYRNTNDLAEAVRRLELSLGKPKNTLDRFLNQNNKTN